MVPLNPKAIKEGAKLGWKTLVKAAPTLGVIFGVGLMGAGAVKTGMETPQMKVELDELEEKEGLSHKEYLMEKARIIAIHLGIPVIMVTGGGAMIFAGYRIKYVQAGIATAALASKTEELEKWKSKFVDKYGEKEYEKMQDDITKDDVKAHPVNYATIINTGHGNTLCYDPILHDYFWSDLDFIRKMAATANQEMLQTQWQMRKATMSYDEWREYLDLPTSEENIDHFPVTSVKIGRDVGWCGRPIELKITAIQLSDDSVAHVIGFTESGAPRWRLNLEDENGASMLSDDETDMPWRT